MCKENKRRVKFGEREGMLVDAFHEAEERERERERERVQIESQSVVLSMPSELSLSLSLSQCQTLPVREHICQSKFFKKAKKKN